MTTALLLVGAALAGGDWNLPPDFDGAEDTPRSVSITIAPLALLDRPLLDGPTGAPVLEATVELRAGADRSVALSAAAPLRPRAVVAGERPAGLGWGDRAFALQVRQYVSGSFENGIAMGAKALLVNPSLSRLHADGAEIGPFLLVKVTYARITLEAGAGPAITVGPSGVAIRPVADVAVGVTF